MDKEWNQLREKTVWDETVVREWADVAAEAIRDKKEVHFGWLFGIRGERIVNFLKTISFARTKGEWSSRATGS